MLPYYVYPGAQLRWCWLKHEARNKKVLPYQGPETHETIAYRDGKCTTSEVKQELIAKVVCPVVGDHLAKAKNA